MQLLWFDCGIYIIRMSCWPVGPWRNISREPSYVSISYYFLDFEDSISKSTFWKRSQVFWCKSHDTYTSDLHFAPWAQQLQRLQALGRPIKVADLPAEVVRKRKMEETTPTLGLEASCQTNRGFRSHGPPPKSSSLFSDVHGFPIINHPFWVWDTTIHGNQHTSLTLGRKFCPAAVSEQSNAYLFANQG